MSFKVTCADCGCEGFWGSQCPYCEAKRLQAIIDKLPRQPNGEYLQCPMCRQYLDLDGTCPEGCGNIGQWLEQNERARDKVVKLEAIVDKLPKTADGVSVMPGMEVWYWINPEHKDAILISCKVYSFNRTEFLTDMDGWLKWGYCYSTQEAAKAAKDK